MIKNISKIEKEIKETLDRIAKEPTQKKYAPFGDYELVQIKLEITEVIEKIFGFAISTEDIHVTFPPEHVTGDLALSVFNLTKTIGKKTSEITVAIAEYFKNPHKFILSANAVGGFLNLSIDKTSLYDSVLKTILKLDIDYGNSDIQKGKIVVIDYSAPNIAKPIGIGHLRSTIIGHVLGNLYTAVGFSVIRDNHLGDWGTQFGALIYAYKNWGDQTAIDKDPIRELNRLYIKFNELAGSDPSLKERARELFNKLECKDAELLEIWELFSVLSRKNFQETYDKLGINFDTSIGESYFTEPAQEMIDDLLSQGFCRKEPASQTVIVDSIAELPSFLLRKEDGSTLYLSRDLATLKFRIEIFKPDIILYVVGSEQELSFKQLFAFAKHIGLVELKPLLKHIGFGMVLVEGKKMSTRKGTLIELGDLVSQSVEKALKILQEKGEKTSEMSESERIEVANILGIGAILYNDLRQSRIKNISFDWDRLLNFEVGSAVYLQYTCVRIESILQRLREDVGADDKNTKLAFSDTSEFSICKKLLFFPEIIITAQQGDSPHHICTYLEELAQSFNNFYNKISILGTEDKILQKSRIILCKCVGIVIRNGLHILNIKIPKKM